MEPSYYINGCPAYKNLYLIDSSMDYDKFVALAENYLFLKGLNKEQLESLTWAMAETDIDQYDLLIKWGAERHLDYQIKEFESLIERGLVGVISC